MTQEPTFEEFRAAIMTALQNANCTHSGPLPARVETPLTMGQAVELARNLPKLTFSHRVQVKLAADGEAGLARLLRRSRTLERHFDEHKKYIHLDGGAFCSLSTAIPIARACAQILKGALLHSVDDAARACAGFLNSGTFPLKTVHLVKGPRVPNPIDLDPNCQLVPYATVAAMIGPSIVDSPSDIRIPLDAAADGCGLIITTALRPGASRVLLGGATVEDQIGDGERARLEYKGIAKYGPDFICAMLGVVTRKAFYPFCHVELVEDVYSDTLPMNAGRGGYSAENVEFPIFPSEDQLTEVDRTEFVSLVTAFAETSDSVRQHLMIPLARLRMAMTRRDHFDRCIDLCVALEALVGDWHLKGFSERIAWMYSHVSGDYDAALRTAKGFHGHRGRIVHAQPVKERPELVEEAMSILIDCIKWVVRQGRIPDWKTERP